MNNFSTNSNFKKNHQEFFQMKAENSLFGKGKIKDNSRNYNNICYINEQKSNNYFSINLDEKSKENAQILNPCIYRTIKYANKRNNVLKNSRTLSNNDFIKLKNKFMTKKKKIYLSPLSTFLEKTNYRDNSNSNSNLSINNIKKNQNLKKKRNPNSNQCFTEMDRKVKNKRIVSMNYYNLFDIYRINKKKNLTNNNSFTKDDKPKNNKYSEKKIFMINKNFTKINCISSNHNTIIRKENNKKSAQKSRNKKELRERNIPQSQKISDNFKINIVNNSIDIINKSKIINNNKYPEKKRNTKSKKNITLNLFKQSSNSSLIYKFINIIDIIIKKRKQKIWKYIKYKIIMPKYFNNNIFNVQSILYNNFQIKHNSLHDQLLDNFDNTNNFDNNSTKNSIILKNYMNSNENICLEDTKIFNNKINRKKIKIIGNINNENKKLKSHLKNLYIKYLLSKKIHRDNTRLQKSFYEINKKSIIINNKEIYRKYLLKKIIQEKERINKFKLKIYFIKFYYKTKSYNQQIKSFCFKDFQDDFFLMQKLYQFIYQKEKYNILLLKKYFDKFRLNISLKHSNIMKNNKSLSFDTTYNSQMDFDKRIHRLKLIVLEIIKHNNMIVKNILMKWLFRTKIINLIMENKKNNSIDHESLLGGINKLNSIFNTHKTINEKNNCNDDKKVEYINEDNDLNLAQKELKNDLYNKDNKLIMFFREKYKTESIIEEKDEEQTEE